MIAATLAFPEDPANVAAARSFVEYGWAAIHMKRSADRAGIEAHFIGTSAGVMVVSESPLPALTNCLGPPWSAPNSPSGG
jgi:hypothetical protein